MLIPREADVSERVDTVATGVSNLVDSGHINRENYEGRVKSVMGCTVFEGY